MTTKGKWELASFQVPTTTETVRLIVTYIDDSYINQEGGYVFFEADGHLKDGEWYISPPRYVADSYQEAAEKLKVICWQYKTPHPQIQPVQGQRP